MKLTRRVYWAVSILLLAWGGVACQNKDPGKPNAELTVPDIPPAGFQADKRDLGEKSGQKR